MDRALNGVEVPVYSYGKLVGSRTVHNDRLLMFMLRNRAPERFAEGRPKGPDAVGKMERERLKKQWRKEWEAERNAAAGEEEAETLRSLNAQAQCGLRELARPAEPPHPRGVGGVQAAGGARPRGRLPLLRRPRTRALRRSRRAVGRGGRGDAATVSRGKRERRAGGFRRKRGPPVSDDQG